jgi:hypothetical protein
MFLNTYRKNSFDKLCYLNKFILIISSLVVKFKEKLKIKNKKKKENKSNLENNILVKSLSTII